MRGALAAFILILFSSYALAEGEYGLLFPTPDESVLDLLVREDIARADQWYWSLGVGGALYEARQGLFMARWEPEVQLGRRFGRTGVFFRFAYDESFDFTQDIQKLEVYHVGLGVEQLFLYGRLRTSLSAGIAILGTETDFDEKGTHGWFVDFRPASIRFEVFKSRVLEISPFTLNLSVPVPKGIPLILFSYFTTVSLEFGSPW